MAFSARVNSTDDLAGRAGAFDGFILKPISPTHLVKRVDAYLHLRREPADGFQPLRRSPTGTRILDRSEGDGRRAMGDEGLKSVSS